MIQTIGLRMGMAEQEDHSANVTQSYNCTSSPWITLLLRIMITIGVIMAMTGIDDTANAANSDVSTSKEKVNREKRVYLSFDDGPGIHTREVLDILREEKVPATFFVLGQQGEQYPELIRTVVEDGHAVGNHTYDHNYKQLYSDFKVFWKQIKQTEEIINRITGFRPNLVRAPGGSYGHFDQRYFDLLKQGGYTVMDWNVDSGDSKRKGVPAKEILRNATKVPSGTNSVIVLMHDGGAHAETVKALPEIIQYYRDHGYQFEVMSGSDQPVQFRVNPNKAYQSRKTPSKVWIADHVESNNKLWLPGKELNVEIGMGAATLQPGEFRVEDNQIMVPLRTFMKKFGSNARWNAETRTATVVWKDRIIYANSVSGELTSSHSAQSSNSMTGKVRSQGGTIWVPLRELMEEMGLSIDSMATSEEDWTVKANFRSIKPTGGTAILWGFRYI